MAQAHCLYSSHRAPAQRQLWALSRSSYLCRYPPVVNAAPGESRVLRRGRAAREGPVRQAHAVVLGASIAGLLAARVLSELGWKVTLVEKDRLHAQPPRQEGEPEVDVRVRLRGRAGTPQTRHIHTLLPEGAAALEALFPGVTRELESGGGKRIPFDKCIKLIIGGLPVLQPARGAYGFETVLCSRALIEETIRRHVCQLPGVELSSGQAVKRLLGSNGVVDGVLLQSGKRMPASLVVDASGRGSRCEQWIAEVGGDRPEREVIDCRIMYADALMRPAPQDRKGRGWHVLRVDQAPGQGHRGGIIYEIEHGLWLVGLAGYLGEQPPKEPEEWLKYARALPDLELASLIERAEFLSPVRRIAATANIRRRWECTLRSPAGFIAVGDSLCAPNPIYGQGMTMACLEAIALRSTLRNTKATGSGGPLPAKVCAKAQAACAKAAESSWALASGIDEWRLWLEDSFFFLAILKLVWLTISAFLGVRSIVQAAVTAVAAGRTSKSPVIKRTRRNASKAALFPEAYPTPQRAVVACVCGKTKMTFAKQVPRMSLECCCVDCRQAFEWAASMGGPDQPAVPQWHYFENDIEEVQGAEHLQPYLLRRGARVTRLVATCCHTTLVADHPVYQGNVVAVSASACSEHLPPQARIWTKDRDLDEDCPLSPYLGPGPCLRGDEPFWFLQIDFPFSQPVSRPRRGFTLQQLLAQLGSPIVLDLSEGQRLRTAKQ